MKNVTRERWTLTPCSRKFDDGVNRSNPHGSEHEKKEKQQKPKYNFGQYKYKKEHKESKCLTRKRVAAEKVNSSGNVDSTNCCVFLEPRLSIPEELWWSKGVLRSEENDQRFELGQQHSSSVKGKCYVRIVTTHNGSDIVTLKATLLVPEIRTNLVPIAKILDKNNEVTFSKDCAIVKDTNENIMGKMNKK